MDEVIRAEQEPEKQTLYSIVAVHSGDTAIEHNSDEDDDFDCHGLVTSVSSLESDFHPSANIRDADQAQSTSKSRGCPSMRFQRLLY